MILPSDQSYQETKGIKLGGLALPPPFDRMAAWISSEYGVEVLNVRYDILDRENTPRLEVIVESKDDEKMFRGGGMGNFDPIAQKRIAEKFTALVEEQDDRRFNTKYLFVIFSAFEPLARVEANQSVTRAQLDDLKKKLAHPHLWEVSRLFDAVTYFFFTAQQVKKYEALRDEYRAEYAKLTEPYDEFGYLADYPVPAYFDSKENFDKNYGGNWYYYYK